jgi:hypothetical protein
MCLVRVICAAHLIFDFSRRTKNTVVCNLTGQGDLLCCVLLQGLRTAARDEGTSVSPHRAGKAKL